MKHPKISRRVETRPYGRVSTPTGNCRKFLTQLSIMSASAPRSTLGRRLPALAKPSCVPCPGVGVVERHIRY